MKLILFEKSRVELEFVFSIFTTRVRKHFGNSGSIGAEKLANFEIVEISGVENTPFGIVAGAGKVDERVARIRTRLPTSRPSR